ncbi:MAG TPA: flagellar export chaperone FliS [Acidimicrobiales bacterium]|nr:flagellar export chaperone FliS [Acidimicrobiales bacterium]
MPASIVQAEALRQRYLNEAVVTASPATRLIMLYDQMLLDFRVADDGFERGDLKAVNDSLCNAQEILLVLRGTLRTDLWGGAEELASLYLYLHQQLVEANLHKDRDQARRAGELVGDLAGAWHQAAEIEAEQHSPEPMIGRGAG